MSATKEFNLICLENPILDIQVYGDISLLQKYGLKANDAILAETDLHKSIYEDLLNNYSAYLIAGGGAQNTARGAQYLLPPNSVIFIGGIGEDKYAETLKEAAKKAGLRVEYRIDTKKPTGRCGVVITGHNRSMVTDLGAANHYDLNHLKSPEVWKLVENAEFYFVGGYHITVCPPAIQALAEEAAAKNKTFIFSLSAPFIPKFFKEPLDETAPYWDYVIGNETEALAYAESHNLKSTDIKEIAKSLAALPKKNTQRKRTAIITQGTEPTIVVVDGEEPQEFLVHPIESSLIIDTTGAGDAFAAGFIAGLISGVPLAQAIDQGQWLAKLSIQELGASFPYPKQLYEAKV